MALWTSTKRDARQFGPYHVVEALGGGGMGRVYRCRHANAGQTVAVKVLRPELADDPALIKRFVQEFQAASRLRHPNVVQVLGFERAGDTCYLVMEYVDGQSLWD